MGVTERETDANKKKPVGKPGGNGGILSALEMHGKGNRSAISKELRKLSMLMRNVKETGKAEGGCAGPQSETHAVTADTHENGQDKSDFSRIDDFISAAGDSQDLSIDDIIRSGAPAGDYFAESDFTATECSDGGSSQISSIDSFLEAVKSGDLKNACYAAIEEEEIADCGESGMDDDERCVIDEEFYTESLAKIYIKQRRYDRALEIINKLSLIYPEKNIYFADQIRFLKKLTDNIKTE